MFNESFGVRKVFICPEVDYFRRIINEPPKKNTRDLSTLLGGLLSKRVSNRDLIFICGGPGSGKSTICKLLCDQLSKNENIYPVLLKLRKLKDCNNVTGFIEKSLRNEHLIGDIQDLRLLKNIVIVLDGFDEVVMANRDKLKNFFIILKDELQTYPFRETKIIISGRDTLFPNGYGIPDYSHVLELRPFNKQRGKRWGEKWNDIKNCMPNGKKFRPEIHFSSEESEKKTALNHLVSWPLTLHLVARVHANGFIDLSKNINIGKAFIYKFILHDTSLRQESKGGDFRDLARFDQKTMRKFLMEVARCVRIVVVSNEKPIRQFEQGVEWI
nr:ATP-binding protein [uncultured Desulfobacter sp.]